MRCSSRDRLLRVLEQEGRKGTHHTGPTRGHLSYLARVHANKYTSSCFWALLLLLLMALVSLLSEPFSPISSLLPAKLETATPEITASGIGMWGPSNGAVAVAVDDPGIPSSVCCAAQKGQSTGAAESLSGGICHEVRLLLSLSCSPAVIDR